LHDLEVIPDDYATHLYKLYSAKGWSKGEPLDQHWPLQEPRVLRDALNLIVDAGVRGKSDLLATEFSIAAEDVENLCGLPQGWFQREPADVVTLKTGVLRTNSGNQPEGEVLAFPVRRPTG
jgi:hypothetical protein